MAQTWFWGREVVRSLLRGFCACNKHVAQDPKGHLEFVQ